ncbi:hypothetical protein [Microlunatus sp. GCM10028923]|uniref:hypothetical protein n=1 Tax=Microlunatus sp. GCM10028923 TaxID=3273400 RepID=UPI0036205959
MTRVMIKVLAAMVLAALFGACSVFGTTGLPNDPVRAHPLPPDQLVLEITYGVGGLAPSELYATTAPWLLAYGDGRLIMAEEQNYQDGWHRGYRQTMIDPELVAGLAERARAAGLDRELDFGSPRVTDAGSLSLRLHGTGEPMRHQAYAFGPEMEKGMSPWLRGRRDLLRSLIDNAESLAGDAAWQPYRPELIFVYEQRRHGRDKGTAEPWPGPDPDRFLTEGSKSFRGTACGELRGPEAEQVYQASLRNRFGQWTVAGEPRKLLINALPGSRAACGQ